MRNHSSAALVTKGAMFGAVAYWKSASKRWTPPNFSAKPLPTGYS